MSNLRPDTVEEWAPLFLTYSGSGAAKFTKEQVLSAAFAITGEHCKLCDAHLTEPAKEHMRRHRRELTAWLAKRRAESARKSLAGLAASRRERKMERETIHEPTEEEE